MEIFPGDYVSGTEVAEANVIGIENVTGTEAPDQIRGNGAANILRGMGGNDTLEGGGGADTLEGGRHDDTYVVRNGGVDIIELADEGTDEVQAYTSHTLAANVENLTLLSGAEAIGNDLGNVITGNALPNVIDGRGGADTMIGGDNTDYYSVDNVDDEVIENPGEGQDFVSSSISFKLRDNVENLTLLDEGGAIDGTGNDLLNRIVGNASDNVLEGHGAYDELLGGRGNDILTGGADGDAFLFSFGDEIDTVTDFVAGDDSGDTIGLIGYGFDDYERLQDFMTQQGSDVVIQFDDENVIDSLQRLARGPQPE